VLKHLSLGDGFFNPVFSKIDKCRECRYYYVCDGICKRYIELFGDEEFTPIKGEKIINPLEILNKKPTLKIHNIAANFVFFMYAKIAYFLLTVFFRKRIKRVYGTMDKVLLGKNSEN
jgi:hypothetical protein